MSTWTLRKSFRFEAAHHLPHHDGRCARRHGHSWVGWVEVRGDRLQREGSKAGMLIDYGDLAAAVDPLVDAFLDHWDLNESTGLENPTSEALAQWMFARLAPVLPRLVAVEVEETCTSSCRYERGA
jgi:6-pyruvoyltetrahydropterin/6-carboxytetrahydropterin synthase